MNNSIKTSCIFLLLHFFLLNTFGENIEKTMMHRASHFIQKKYQLLNQELKVLEQSLDQLCRAPSVKQQKHTKSLFQNVVIAWSKAEIIYFGPIREQYRFERFYYFPDRKSLALKQIIKAINKKNTALLDGKLQERSAALQGLNALEYTLFGRGSEILASEKDSFRCKMSLAVAHNLKSISDELLSSWEKDHVLLELNEKQARQFMITVLVHSLERVKDIKIASFLKKEAKFDKPKLAPLWRSQNTITMIKSNLNSIYEFYTHIHPNDLLEDEAQYLSRNFSIHHQGIVQNMPVETISIKKILQNKTSRENLVFIQQLLNEQIQLINNDLAGAFNVIAGFSANDGD